MSHRWLSLLALLPSIALAEGPTLEVSGALPKSGHLTLAELEAMKPEKATVTDHGKSLQVEGVPLYRILTTFGFEPGVMGKGVAPAMKLPGYKKVVLVTSKDGFQAVFSCAELAENLGPTRALLAWKVDGKPIDAEKGPLQLFVLTDQGPLRSGRSVVKIQVVDVAPPAPAQPATGDKR